MTLWFAMVAAMASSAERPVNRCEDGRSRHMAVTNAASLPVERLFAVDPVLARHFDEDLLGDDVLRPATTIDINMDVGTCHCDYELRAVFADGHTASGPIDICASASFTVDLAGISPRTPSGKLAGS